MKLLVVEPRSLFPPDSGAKILSANILRHLAGEHAVAIVSNISDDDRQAQIEQMSGLGAEVVPVAWKEMRNFTPRFYIELARCIFTGELYSVKKFCTPGLMRAASELAARGEFDE